MLTLITGCLRVAPSEDLDRMRITNNNRRALLQLKPHIEKQLLAPAGRGTK